MTGPGGADRTPRPTALVTGATKGLGTEVRRQLAARGLSVLLTIEQEMEDQNKPMQLCHVSDVIRDVFDVTGFLDILKIV